MSDAAVARAAKEARHLYEIDIVRILTFLCVIAVHTTSYTAGSQEVGLYAFLGLVHFTREVFFALTGFVLILSFLNRPVPMRKFWPRRFLLVGVPYLVWSTIYFVSSSIRSPSGTFGDSLLRYLIDLLTGTAWYHLYFLLVTMQVYLLVPVVIWLIRKTRGHHLALLLAAAVFQLALTSYYMYSGSVPSWLGDNAQSFFFSYILFILIGAVAADHASELISWVRSRRGRIGLFALAAAIVTLAVLAYQHFGLGYSLSRSVTPLQPVMMFWSIAVALGFLAIGGYWADRRVAGSRFSRLVDIASDRSFGIFLSHPLVIWLALLVGDGLLARTVPRPWLLPVTYLIVITGAILVTELARRTPVSLALTGRPYRRRKPTVPAAIPASETAGAPRN